LESGADSDKDGNITFREICDYVEREVSDWARANGKQQDPIIKTSGRGSRSLVLARTPEATLEAKIARLREISALSKVEKEWGEELLRYEYNSKSMSPMKMKHLKLIEELLRGTLSPAEYGEDLLETQNERTWDLYFDDKIELNTAIEIRALLKKHRELAQLDSLDAQWLKLIYALLEEGMKPDIYREAVDGIKSPRER
jgi:hypothetical protein